MRAKKKAKQMEASILKEEEAIQTETRNVEEDYAKKLKELEVEIERTRSLEKETNSSKLKKKSKEYKSK